MVGESGKGSIVVVSNIRCHLTNFSFALVQVFLMNS